MLSSSLFGISRPQAFPYGTRTYAPTKAGMYQKFDTADTLRITDAGILLEHDGSNVLNKTEKFDSAVWNKGNTQVITGGNWIAPNGRPTAQVVRAIGTSVPNVNRGGIGLPGAWCCWSIHVKPLSVVGNAWSAITAVDGTGSSFVTWYDVVNGTVGSTTNTGGLSGVINLANGWKRIWLSRLATAGVNCWFYAYLLDGDGFLSGSLNNEYLFWGAQLEPNTAYPTSYMPADATSTGRYRDRMVMAPQGLNFGSQGTIWLQTTYINFDIQTSDWSQRCLFGMAADTTNYFLISRPNAGSGVLTCYSKAAPGANQQFSFTGLTHGQPMTVAVAWDAAGGARGCINGGSIVTSATVTMPPYFRGLANAFYTQPGNLPTTGGASDGQSHWGMPIEQMGYFPRALSNAELQSLTTNPRTWSPI